MVYIVGCVYDSKEKKNIATEIVRHLKSLWLYNKCYSILIFMKKKSIPIVGATAIAVAAAVFCLNMRKSAEEILFMENVEALSESERNYSSPEWWVHHRDDGGINCTHGGSERCVLD